LKGQELGVSSADVIGEILKNSDGFSRLTLSNNHLGDLGVFRLSDHLKANPNLIHIDISSNDLTTSGLSSFLSNYESNSSVISFDLSSYNGLNRNKFGQSSSESLSSLIKSSPVLQILELNEVNLTDSGLEKLSESLPNHKSIFRLSLVNNYLTSKSLESFCSVLLSTKLEELNLSQNKVGDIGAHLLGKMLSDNDFICTLKRLDISRNEISHKGGSQFFHCIQHNANLDKLNIEGNALGSKVGQSLHFLMLYNFALTDLNLKACGLKSEGISHLALGLAKNKKLLQLNLDDNECEEISILVEALAENKVLRKISIGHNFIRNGSDIAKIIKNNEKLQVFDFCENRVKDEFGLEILDAVKKNAGIFKVQLDGNYFSLRTAEEIRIACKRNEECVNAVRSLKFRSEVKKVKNEYRDLKSIEEEINKKQFEKVRIVNKVGKLKEQLNLLRQSPDTKLDELKKDLQLLREKNQFLSVDLEIALKELGKYSIIEEKAKKEKHEKLFHISSEVTALTSKCKKNLVNSLKEQIKLKRLHFESTANTLKSSLSDLDVYKRSVLATRDALTTGLHSINSQIKEINPFYQERRQRSPQPLKKVLKPRRKEHSTGLPERRVFVFSPSTRPPLAE
jgi:regulator of replication initiation timing